MIKLIRGTRQVSNTYHFAKLLKNKMDSSLFETVQDYYENLIRVTPANEKGQMKFDPVHLTNMIEAVKTREDLEITIHAYYNFLGHYCSFGNKNIDSLLQKAIDIEACDLTHPVSFSTRLFKITII